MDSNLALAGWTSDGMSVDESKKGERYVIRAGAKAVERQ